MKPGYLERPSRVLLGYLLVALVFAAELLVPGRSLYRGDTLFTWPVLLEARSQILSGHWPFWASSYCNGTPLLASAAAAVLYPLRWLCWLLPLKAGYHAFLFLHVWLTFAGMHLFLRRGLGLPWIAAVAGALTFGASGYARAMWDTHAFVALPWIPLGLAAMLEARRRMRLLIPAAMMAGCWSMMILAGDLQAASLWLPVALLLAVFLPERVLLLRVAVLAAGLAVLLTAVQWLPAAYALAESHRAAGLPWDAAVQRSFNPVRVVEFVLPHAFGTRDTWYGAALAGANGTQESPWLASAHIGIVAWLPVYLGLRRLRKPVVAWALVVATASLLLSYGRFLPGFSLWQNLPLIHSFRYPEKYLLWTTLGLGTIVAIGTATLARLIRRPGLTNVRHVILSRWSIVMLMGAIAAALVVYGAAGDQPGLFRWLRGIYANSLLVVLLVLVVGLRTWRGPQQAVLIGVVLVDLLLPWYAEKPTTSLFDPVAETSVSQVIAASDSPRGRFFRDRAVSRLPLPGFYTMLSASGQQAVQYREAMAEAVPRLWGLRSADGRSSTESGPMLAFRRDFAAPAHGETPVDDERLAIFCRQSAVEWLMTTPRRFHALASLGLDLAPHAVWGTHADVILARVRGGAEAQIAMPVPEEAPEIRGFWRPKPGAIRIDLTPGAACRLAVSETYSAGWRAVDGHGAALKVEPYNGCFLGIELPGGVSQVRLAYEPGGWKVGALASAAGIACMAAALFQAFRPRLRRTVQKPVLMACAAALVFVVVGGAARHHWSCVLDEGQHVMQGSALAGQKDSRMSYVQPPLQNLVNGYMAHLAWGDRIRWPDTKAWRSADASLYAVDVAAANSDIFTDLVRASRNGSALFAVLLCVVGVYWAARSGGPLAGWLAAAGLSLNPLLLTHGHVATTDMAFTALVVAGTFFAWRGARGMPWRNLFWALCCFSFAATAKFTGFIWLGVFLLVCVPCFAWQETRPSLLFLVIVGFGFFVLCLLTLYGPLPQEVRAPGLAWSGARITAGRFIEGLVTRAGEAMAGGPVYILGELKDSASPLDVFTAVLLKTPVAWSLAAIGGLAFVARRLMRTEVLIPLLPALFFATLLFAANRLAADARQALPLVALAVVATAIAVGRLRSVVARRLAAVVLAASSLASVASSYPRFIAYVPAPVAMADPERRWLAGSDYDWGQDLDELERRWASLADEAGGGAPNLLYYGFVDPRMTHHLRVGPHSYCGYMELRAIEEGGREIVEQWRRQRFRAFEGTTVASASFLRGKPAGIIVAEHHLGVPSASIGSTFSVFRKPDASAEAP
jgi:hypothetical protein